RVNLRDPALADPMALLRFVGVSWLGIALVSLVFLSAFGGLTLVVCVLLASRLLLVPTLVAGGATIGEAVESSWLATSGRAGKTLALLALLSFAGVAWTMLMHGLGPLISSEPAVWGAWAVVTGVPVVVLVRLSLVSATQDLVASAKRSIVEVKTS